MNLSRRTLLRASAVTAAGLTGCLSRHSNVRYPSSEAEGGDGGNAVGVDPETHSDMNTRAASIPAETTPHPDLARSTDAIYDEVRWFATDYEPSMEAYRKAVSTVIDTVERVRDDDSLTEVEIGAVRNAAENAIAVAKEELAPHFTIYKRIRDNTRYHLSIIEKFTRRSDYDRVMEEVQRLKSVLAGTVSKAFINRWMPSHPVQNRLFNWLLRTRKHPAIFELRYTGGYAAYAYEGDHVSILGKPLNRAAQKEYFPLFAPLETPDAREDALSILVHPLPGKPPYPPKPPQDLSTLSGRAIRIQRFADSQVARSALTDLLKGEITQESTYTMAGADWRRVYYRYKGDVIYTFLLQAGEYLLAIGPDQTAWEERFDWQGSLTRTWLWESG